MSTPIPRAAGHLAPFLGATLVGLLGLHGRCAHAASVPIDINSLVPPAAVKIIATTFAVLTEHRSYSGATQLGSGLDLGIDATLVHAPDGFSSALSDAGFGSGAASIQSASLPMAKIHLGKSVGEAFDIGVSGLWFRGNYLLGGDLKVPVYRAEEGLSWALRFSYEVSHLDLTSLNLQGIPINYQGNNIGTGGLIADSRTMGVQLLASRRLDFAEPYVGVGVSMATGQLEFPITISFNGDEFSLITDSYSEYPVDLFTGVSFRVPYVGLHLAIQGSYNTLGMHTLGVLVGFQF